MKAVTPLPTSLPTTLPTGLPVPGSPPGSPATGCGPDTGTPPAHGFARLMAGLLATPVASPPSPGLPATAGAEPELAAGAPAGSTAGSTAGPSAAPTAAPGTDPADEPAPEQATGPTGAETDAATAGLPLVPVLVQPSVLPGPADPAPATPASTDAVPATAAGSSPVLAGDTGPAAAREQVPPVDSGPLAATGTDGGRDGQAADPGSSGGAGQGTAPATHPAPAPSAASGGPVDAPVPTGLPTTAATVPTTMPTTVAATVPTTVPTTPVAAQPAPAGPGHGSPAAQLLPEVTRLVSRGDGVHRLTMRLQPEALGEVRVTLTVRHGEVQVRLAAGDEARRSLIESAPELRRILESAGASEARVLVRDLAPVAAASTTTTGLLGHDAASGGDPQRSGDAATPQQGRGDTSDQHARTRAGTDARDGLTDGAPPRPEPARRDPHRGLDLTM